MKDYLQNLDHCPFCKEKLITCNGFNDYDFKLGFNCPGEHYQGNKSKNISFWGWGNKENDKNNILAINTRVYKNKEIYIQMNISFSYNKTKVYLSNELFYFHPPNSPKIIKHNTPIYKLLYDDSIFEFPYEEEKFKNKMFTLVNFL